MPFWRTLEKTFEKTFEIEVRDILDDIREDIMEDIPEDIRDLAIGRTFEREHLGEHFRKGEFKRLSGFVAPQVFPERLQSQGSPFGPPKGVWGIEPGPGHGRVDLPSCISSKGVPAVR